MSKSIRRVVARAWAPVVEMLETRRMLTTVALTGTSGNDNFTISYDSGAQQYSFTGGVNVPSSIAASDFTGFTLTGGGGADTLAIQGGSPTLLNDASADGTGLSVTVAPGASLEIAVGEQLTALNIGATSSVQVRQSGYDTLILGSLTIAETNNAWTGSLDLADNDLIVHNSNLTTAATSLATITNQLKSGFNAGSGYWNGQGIASTAAAALTNTALGVEVNNDGTAAHNALLTSFDGQTVINTDVLVKYTYYGDANLDGVVNGSDYTLIDNGFNANLAGWRNGDFNYDGVVNGSDYLLIDNAFNTQNTQALHEQITFSVPSTVEIDLSWAASTDPSVYAYNVYRSTTPGFTPSPSNIVAIETPETSLQDVDLTPNTTYYYALTAAHDDGTETTITPSGSATTLTTDTSQPDQPINLTAVADNDTDIDLSWTDQGNNATGYVVEQSNDSGSTWQTVDTVSAGSQGDTIFNLTPNTT